MKKIALLVAASAALFSCSNNNSGYTIDVNIKDFDDLDSLYVYEGEESKAQAAVKDGKVTITGKTEYPAMVMIGNRKNNFYFPLILENDKYTVKVSKQDLDISGGAIHEKVNAYKKSAPYLALFNSFKELQKRKEATKDTAEARTILADGQEIGRQIMELEDSILTAQVKQSKDAELRFFSMLKHMNPVSLTFQERLDLIEELKPEIGETPPLVEYRKVIKQQIAPTENAAESATGGAYKDVSAKDRSGKVVKLSDIVKKNKFTILEFWASWCPPCRQELPNLKKVYQEFKGKGLAIMSISIDEEASKWHKALDEEQTPWYNTRSVEQGASSPAGLYGVKGIPANFLISQDGKIVAADMELRGENLRKTLAKFLK